jgi:uncharacterized RDD family membrane protein YckC
VISASIDKAVVQAVEIDPSRRWQSVRDVHNLLLGATGSASFVSSHSPMAAAGRMATQVALPPAPLPLASLVRPPAPVAGSAPGRAAPPLYVPSPTPYIQSLPTGLLGRRSASYSQRAVAYLVNVFLFIVLYRILATVTPALLLSGAGGGAGPGILSLLLFFLSIYACLIWPTATSGQTLGKKMLHIHVVEDNGSPPGWGKSFLRYLIGFPLESMFFYLGLLWQVLRRQEADLARQDRQYVCGAKVGQVQSNQRLLTEEGEERYEMSWLRQRSLCRRSVL